MLSTVQVLLSPGAKLTQSCLLVQSSQRSHSRSNAKSEVMAFCKLSKSSLTTKTAISGSAEAVMDLAQFLLSSWHSVGLHDEMNWIIAIVGLCSLSEGNYLGYMAVNESNHWHKACHTPLR